MYSDGLNVRFLFALEKLSPSTLIFLFETTVSAVGKSSFKCIATRRKNLVLIATYVGS